MWCLPKETANKFLGSLKDGELSIEKLISLSSSKEKEAYLGRFVGEWNAKYVNTAFEGKLLLKNQQKGIARWILQTAGIKNIRLEDFMKMSLEEQQKLIGKKVDIDILSKIQKLSKALNPKEGEAFLSDIIEKRLGVSLTETEAKTITELTQKMESLYNPARESWEQAPEYYQTKQQINKFMREATPEIFAITKTDMARKITASALSVARALKVGLDISFTIGRQARALVGTKQWVGAISRVRSYLKTPIALDELEVKMLSHKYSKYVIDNKKELGLTLLGEKFTQREENYAAKIIEKIPILGSMERANVGFINDLRFNRFVDVLENFEKSGKGITDNPEAMKDLAKVIGASTGRGTLGKFEVVGGSLSTALFSPRFFTSRFQVLLNPLTKSGPARIEAIKDLARLAGTSFAVLGMLKAAGADVEIDPRSSDFGKVRIGNTRIDMTGGTGQIIVLFTRIGMGLAGKPAVKSSTSGKIVLLNSESFGSQTVMDLVNQFFLNKASPVGGIIRDLLKGQNFQGKPIEIGLTKDFGVYLANQLLYPMISTTAYDAFKSGGMVEGSVALFSELVGFGAQTYPDTIEKQARDLYQEGDMDGFNTLLNESKKKKEITDTKYDQIKRDKNLPTDVIYFRDLTDNDQKKLLKSMDISDLQRFYWYANKDVKDEDIVNLSDKARAFIDSKNRGEFKKPQWDKGETK